MHPHSTCSCHGNFFHLLRKWQITIPQCMVVSKKRQTRWKPCWKTPGIGPRENHRSCNTASKNRLVVATQTPSCQLCDLLSTLAASQGSLWRRLFFLFPNECSFLNDFASYAWSQHRRIILIGHLLVGNLLSFFPEKELPQIITGFSKCQDVWCLKRNEKSLW